MFKKITSTKPVIDYLVKILNSRLESGQKVFWLVTGGSAIAIAVEVSKQLDEKLLHNLTITLTDERYGIVGHRDSNWQQLKDNGFSLPTATLKPVLSGEPMPETTANFAKMLKAMFREADFSLGLFGIGPDGHTAGILPGSSAVNEKSLAHGYDGGIYQRITMTVPAIAKLDEAVVYVVGEPKWAVLDQLERDLPLSKQPAQILKQVPKLTIFNDYKGA